VPSGKRIVIWGGAAALAGAAVVLGAFSRWGLDTFTRSARTVEARGRAFELASAIARCVNRSGRSTLPPSAGPVPETVHEVRWGAAESDAAFHAEAFTCAGFHPRGVIHVQIAWNQEGPLAGVAIGRLDEDGDGTVDFEARSRVSCDGAAPEPCHAAMVEEFRPDGGLPAAGERR